MILSYITDTYSIKPAAVKTEQVIVMIESKPELTLLSEDTGNTDSGNTDFGNSVTENTDNRIIEKESYEMKYKLLMQKIEKERFERELLADTR